MVLCRLQSPWALAPTRNSTPHLLDHYPRSLGVKAVLKLVLPLRLSQCRMDDELTQFRYLFHDLYTLMASSICRFLDSHTDFVTLRSTA